MQATSLLRNVVRGIAAFAWFTVGAQAFAQGTFEIHAVHSSPDIIIDDQPFFITITGFNFMYGLPDVYENGLVTADPKLYTVTVDGSDIFVRYEDKDELCITPTLPVTENFPQKRRFRIPGLPAGDYVVHIEYGVATFCGPRWLDAQSEIKIYDADSSELRGNHESPVEGQVVSGVGLIRGWACYYTGPTSTTATAPDIGQISYRIDDGPERTLPHGSLRKDTAEACGGPHSSKVHTGYGAVVSWAKYSSGEHTFTLLIDGQVTQQFPFTIEGSPSGFLKGISASYELEDFPMEGQNVDIEWSEADQNFIIVDFQE